MLSLQNVGEVLKAAAKIGNELGEWFNISIGTKQGDPASPSQFIGIQNNGTGVKGNESTT